MRSFFPKLFIFVSLLVLPLQPLNCIEKRDEDTKLTDYACVMRCNVAGDAHQIRLTFNNSYGNISAVDLDASFQSYVAMKDPCSANLPILCTVTNFETALAKEINEVIRRTKATVHCALPAKDKSAIQNESSISYMSRHMYEITRQIASLIGNYQWLKPSTTVYQEADSVSDLEIVTFNLNSHPTQGAVEILHMATTLSFSTTRPLQYYTELTIAVAMGLTTPRHFVNITHDENDKEAKVTGFWIDVLKEAFAMMPVNITSFKLVPFYGSDDQLLTEVSRKTFDAAVGLTVLNKGRSKLVELPYPYMEVGPTIVMKTKIELNQFLLFMSPFTDEMWLTLALITVFTAFVVWLVEHRNDNESGGFVFRNGGAIFWFSFATLFYGGHRESPKHSLTYFVLGPWLFLVLVITSTYTSSFTSIITSSESDQSSSLNMENLKSTNAIIGCDADSVLYRYIVEVMGFQPKNIKHIAQSSIDEYAKALTSGDIKAAFFFTPYAAVFSAKYCKGFKKWTSCCNNLLGSAIVLPKRSPLVSDMSEAMLRLMDSGKLNQMIQDMLSSIDCSSSGIDGPRKRGIGPGPFTGLFILSGGASAIAMLITIIRSTRECFRSFIQRKLMGRGLWVWLTTLFSQNQRKNELQLSRLGPTSQTQPCNL